MNFAYKDTDEVTGLNRAGVAPELTGQCTPQQLTHGMVAEYYTAPSGVLTPKSQVEIDVIEFNASKASTLTKTTADCQTHIYSYYSAPVQQSMTIGVYPSEMYDAMVVFIAACIEYENSLNDQLEAAVNQAAIDTILAGVTWPVPEEA